MYSMIYEYNINKAYESYFGAITCCSGCLSAYQREIIQKVILFWETQNNNINNNNSNREYYNNNLVVAISFI